MRVLVLRHAQVTDYSDAFRAPISKRGRELALELSKVLSAHLIIICSHFPRSRQTAEALIRGRSVPIETDSRFGEIWPGTVNREQMRLAQMALDAIAEWAAWAETQEADQVLIISHTNLMSAVYNLLTLSDSPASGFKNLCGFEVLLEEGEVLEIKLWRP